MSDNSQKTPFARSINAFAQKKIVDAMETLGKFLPCHVAAVTNSIVTVSFDVTSGFTLPNVTMPMFGPEYIRYPTQIGDKGMTVSADVFLGGVSGLGGGTANLSLLGNLSALIFLPIGKANWSKTDDPNAVVIYGLNGAILRTVDKTSTITVNEAGISIVAANAISLTSATQINLTAPSIVSNS